MGELTFRGVNKNLKVNLLKAGGGFFQMEEMIKILKHIVEKHTQVNLPNLLNGWHVAAGLKGKWFKKTSLVNENLRLLKIWETWEIKQTKLSIKRQYDILLFSVSYYICICQTYFSTIESAWTSYQYNIAKVDKGLTY